MFEGLRDRRPNRDKEAEDAAIAAATSKLARRRAQQTDQSRGTTNTAPHTATVVNQLGMVARQASTVYGPTKVDEAKADAAKTDEHESIEDQSMTEADQTLTVGAGIHLKGEISNCQTLIVEGQVEGSAKSGVLEIADGGSFVGDADIDTAVVSGRFEGTLTATQRLVIRASGRVTGDIRYAAIAIEAGGQISGDIQVTEGPATEGKATSSEGASYPETAAADYRSRGGQDGRVEIAS